MTASVTAVARAVLAVAEPAVNTGDTAWLLTASALVLLMAPGLAFFCGGMVRATSVLNMMMMMMVFGALAVVNVVWVLVGYSIAFGDDLGYGLVGDPTQYLAFKGMLTEAPEAAYPVTLFAIFQGLFAVITVALIAGAIADRTKFGTWLLFAGLWTVLVYAPVAHWIFDFSSDDGSHVGGWMANELHALDFAGGTAVEINSGAAGLAVALVLGTRIAFGREPMKLGYDDSLDVVGDRAARPGPGEDRGVPGARGRRGQWRRPGHPRRDGVRPARRHRWGAPPPGRWNWHAAV
jgi:Amt family ammonium transporter